MTWIMLVLHWFLDGPERYVQGQLTFSILINMLVDCPLWIVQRLYLRMLDFYNFGCHKTVGNPKFGIWTYSISGMVHSMWTYPISLKTFIEELLMRQASEYHCCFFFWKK